MDTEQSTNAIQSENILEDVQSVANNLPKPIRTFLTDGSIEAAAQNITQKNHLHADQGTIIERDLLLVLMGIQEPSSLSQTLSQDANLDEQTLSAVLRDMDELVFAPLHKAMEAAGSILPVKDSTDEPELVVPLPPEEISPIVPAAVTTQQNLSKTQHTPQSVAPISKTTEQSESQPIQTQPKDNQPLVKEYAIDPYRELPE